MLQPINYLLNFIYHMNSNMIIFKHSNLSEFGTYEIVINKYIYFISATQIIKNYIYI